MKTNNQFDASVKSLTTNIPVFVREAYGAYLTAEDELFSNLRSKFVSQPSSVDNLCKRLMCGAKDNSIDIISALRILNGDDANIAISRFLTSKTEIRCDKENIEEPNSESPDIYAPLGKISGGFTNMPNCGKESCNHSVPSIAFQLVTNACTYKPFTSDNSLGFTTVLDCMASECIIDLFDLFDIFFTKSTVLFTNAPSEDVEEGAYAEPLTDEEIKAANYKQIIRLHDMIRNSDISNTIIEEVSKALLKTAITTYLVFAGKLRGVKSDLCGWMYTFFVKDSMRDVEKGDYPTSSDITLQAGMQTHQNVLTAGDPNERDYTNNAADRRNITSSYYKIRTYNGQDPNFDGSVFYKNIRLLYSNWAAVINTIIKIDRNENKIHYESEDINSLKPNNYNSSSVLYEHICIARNLMETYLKCRFRTYNTPFQVGIEKGEAISNDALLKSGINALVDVYNKATVKDCCSTGNDNYFISNSDEIQFVLNSTRAETCVIADKFMAAAYLTMLDYIHTHQEQIITQDDPNTGKPNREQFEEVYEAVKKSVYNFVFKSYDSEEAEVISKFNSLPKETIVKMTIEANGKSAAIPFSRSFDAETNHSILVNGYNKFNMANLASEGEDSSIANGEIKSYQFKHLDQRQADLCKLGTIAINYIVPPLSDEICLKLDAMQGCVTNEPLHYNSGNILSQYQTRATSLFPKNQVVIDEFSKLRMNTKGIFSSMESVSGFGFNRDKINEICDKVAASIESEWAHMSYNDIASIGGEVVDFEVTNEETATVPQTEKPSIEEPILDSSDPQAVTLHAKEHDVDIKENVIADKEPTDSEYIKEVTEATENASAIDRYNRLFNRIVFDIK